MKKVTLFLLLLVVALSMNSQTLLESDSYGLDQYIEKCSDIPVLRQINGGTVFKITYEPEEAWDNAMKGAFEYACKNLGRAVAKYIANQHTCKNRSNTWF